MSKWRFFRLRRQRILRCLILVPLMVLSLEISGISFPFVPLAHGISEISPVPHTSGPIVPVRPFFNDTDAKTSNHNYGRIVVYGWGVDPSLEVDPQNDYFLVFVTGAVQASSGWCVSDGRNVGFNGPSYSPSEQVELSADTGTTFLPEVSPQNGEHGDVIGTVTTSLTVGVSAKGEVGIPGIGSAGTEVSTTVGLAWEQFIYQWNVNVASNSTNVVWKTTEHQPSASCDGNTWTWGYAAMMRVAQGNYPRIEVKFTGKFVRGPNLLDCQFTCGEANVLERKLTLRVPPRVAFETNPLVGSIVLNGTEFGPGQHAFYAQGIYTAYAVAPEGYVFDHWQCGGGGVHVFSGGCESPRASANPVNVLVSGNGFLKAVFAAKLIFLTDPPDLGSISFTTSTCSPTPTSCNGCGSGSMGSVSSYSNGDWTYFSALPPDPTVGGLDQAQARFCAIAPAGYKFDHWSSTAQFIGVDSPVNSTVIIALSVPSTVKAWFVPQTCCPSVDFQTNLNHNGGGSILIGVRDVTTTQLYYPVGALVNPLAVSGEGYVFDRWDISPGLRLDPCCEQSLKSNPPIFDIIDTCSSSPCSPIRSVIAHFLPKATFQTDPPQTGSVSWGGCGASYPSHPDGDWIYVEPYATVTLCANTPTGYRFDHWTTNVGISGALTAPYNDSTSITFWITPVVVKAWFTSINSFPISPTAPSAPSSLVATGQYGHADLTWTIPISIGGSQITGYRIYRGASLANLGPLASIGNQLWYQDSSVTNDQIYYYRVSAVNNVGEGPPSNADSAKPGVDSVTIQPDSRSVLVGGQAQFSAIARSESGEVIGGVSFSWTTSIPGASVTNLGLFKAGTALGTFTKEVSASVGGATGYATVTVQAPPTTRSNAAFLSFDASDSWTWAYIVGTIAAIATGAVLGIVRHYRKANARRCG